MVIAENTINGKSIHFTGQFELGPQYRALQLGATIVKSIVPDTKQLLGAVDFVVAGRSPSSIRLEQARNIGIKMLDEKQFFDLVDPVQPRMRKDAPKLNERWK